MKGVMIVTDKDHSQWKKEIFPALKVPGAEQLKISKKCNSGFYGFGVAITPSSCYELSLMKPSEREELLKQIYGKEGLGLSVARLCIGSSDYSPELYSYDDVPFDISLEHFSVQRDKAYVIPMIREILKINPDLYIFASPWSPPYWMKTGGSMCGGYMRDEYVDCYAEYIVKFIRAYAENGIKISAVTPQNEPETQQALKMPTCVWHPETEAKFICILRRKFEANGLDIQIWMHDHDFYGTERVLWSLENCKGLAEACNGVAFHYYTGSVERTKKIVEKYPQLPLHFTEAGPRLCDHYAVDWCKWGIIISKILKVGYRSFTGWNLILDESGGPNVGPFMSTCGGLVTRDSRSEEISFSGQYKAYSHITPYITPDSDIYSVSVSDSFGMPVSSYPQQIREIEGFVIDRHDGQKNAVLINPNEYGIQAQISLGDALWYLELQADSISTVIVDV